MGCCPKGPPHAPSWPITCNIWFGTQLVVPPVGAPNLAAVPCQIAPGELNWSSAIGTATFIKLPALTDVHWIRPMPAAGYDLIEAPAGSGEWYNVNYVQDIAKGFVNEYRVAAVLQIPPYTIPKP